MRWKLVNEMFGILKALWVIADLLDRRNDLLEDQNSLLEEIEYNLRNIAWNPKE